MRIAEHFVARVLVRLVVHVSTGTSLFVEIRGAQWKGRLWSARSQDTVEIDE